MRKVLSMISALSFIVAVASCGGVIEQRPRAKRQEIVREPEKLEPAIEAQMTALLEEALGSRGKADDLQFRNADVIGRIYEANGYSRIWSRDKHWQARADSFIRMINGAEWYGLFPADYHARPLATIFDKLIDSSSGNDAALWARGDLLLSDAFATYARHLSIGRIPRDSTSLNADSVLGQRFYDQLFARLGKGEEPRALLESLEPLHKGYLALKQALPRFLDSLDRTNYTYLDFPNKDSIAFVRQLQARLFESSYITFNTRMPDSLELAQAIQKAQMARGLKVDGKAGPALVRSLNNTGVERFKRLAINLDRYKHLPDSMPASYIWVNLPAYKMQVIDSGFVVLESKVIVGQPKTRTPVLTSEVTNFITYPQWTVPYSIIFKEMLPKIQKDVRYLAKENLMVVDRYDSVIDPVMIDWSKLSKTNFPYLIRQRQGDDNSLGVIKFNFRNKYAVYLHDTNARSLFARPGRALSHGCVRVQEWDSLSRFLLAKDTSNVPVDSVTAWLSRQEKKTVALKKRVPVYLRYFTVEVTEDGAIRFHEDIYGEDKLLRMRHFARK